MSSSYLWQLIHEMSSNEKRYFRRNFIRYDSSLGLPLYVKLFDEICKQNDYDENAILKILDPQLNSQNIAFTKNYLYETICAALIAYEQTENVEASIIKQLQLIKLLREKGLFNHALKIWNKAIQQARNLELFALVLQLKEEYQKLQLFHLQNEKKVALLDVYNDRVLYYSEYSDFLHLQEMYFRAQMFRRKSHVDFSSAEVAEVKHMLQDNLLINPLLVKSFLFEHYYLQTKSTLLYLLNDEIAYQYAEINIEKWQANPNFIKQDKDNYLEVLYIFYYTAMLAKDYSKVEAVMLHESNNILIKSSHWQYFEATKFLALNRMYNRLAKYDKVKVVVDEMLSKYTTWLKVINTDLKRTLFLSIGISCFVLKNYVESFFQIKQCIQFFGDDTRPEHQLFAYIMLIIICYEMQDELSFDTQIKSAYTQFKKSKKALAFDMQIRYHLNKCFYAKSKSEERQNLKLFLVYLKENKEQKMQQQVFQFFNVPAWVESKIEGISYQDWVRRNIS